jgi:hypothetical protein
MKLIVGLLALCLLWGEDVGLAVASQLPLKHDDVFIRWAKFRYNLSRDAEALMRAQRRLENGRERSEFGINPIKPTSYEHIGDPQAYADPTAPHGSEQYGRWARRLGRELQNYTFSNPQRRADFLIWYSAHYLSGSKKDNFAYFRLLQALFKDERRKMKGKKYNPQGGEQNAKR